MPARRISFCSFCGRLVPGNARISVKYTLLFSIYNHSFLKRLHAAMQSFSLFFILARFSLVFQSDHSSSLIRRTNKMASTMMMIGRTARSPFFSTTPLPR